MKYPKEYLDEIKLSLKVSQVVGKTVQLKKKRKRIYRSYHLLKMKKVLLSLLMTKKNFIIVLVAGTWKYF